MIDYDQSAYGADGYLPYVSTRTRALRDAAGQPFDDRDFAGGDTFPALDPRRPSPTRPRFRTRPTRTAKVPAWLNDPTIYHNRGDSTFAGESNTYGDFPSGLSPSTTCGPSSPRSSRA